MGGYFDESYVKEGKLHISVDFTPKQGQAKQTDKRNPAHSGSVTASATCHSTLRQEPNSPEDSNYDLNQAGAQRRPETSLTRKRKRGQKAIQPRRRTRYQRPFSSDESECEHSVAGDSEHISNGEQSYHNDHPQSLPPHAPLPRIKKLYEAYKVNNALPNEYGHKPDWDISESYRAMVANSRLIKGEYGVPADTPCDNCHKEGKDCRVYHHSISGKGFSCGECRFNALSCSFNSQSQDTSRSSKKRQRTSTNLRLDDTATDNEIEEWLCPVEGCNRASEPFTSHQKLERHVHVVHRGTTVPSVPDGNSPGEAESNAERESNDSHEPIMHTCPVQGCTSRAGVNGFRRLQALHGHIRGCHPSSIHAQNLEGAQYKPVLLVPPAPSLEDLERALDEACRANPKAGGNKHLAQKESRTARRATIGRAHKTCINGKYGLSISMKCTPCLAKGLDCRVYHPDLAPHTRGTRCGNCRVNKKPRCDLEANPLSMYTIQEQSSEEVVPADMQDTIGGPSANPVEDGTKPQVATPKSTSTQRVSNLAEKTGNFFCPVRTCHGAMIIKFSLFDDLRKHILLQHSDTNHGLLLKAIDTGNPTSLRPPSQEDLQEAYDAYRRQNAPLGQFGHRDPITRPWDKTAEDVRQRVAAGRLVHTYGVLAPKPCEHCKTNKITCIASYPDLCLPGGLKGNYCSECKFTSRTCKQDQSMFDGCYIQPQPYDSRRDESPHPSNGDPPGGQNNAPERRRPSLKSRTVDLTSSPPSAFNKSNDTEVKIGAKETTRLSVGTPVYPDFPAIPNRSSGQTPQETTVAYHSKGITGSVPTLNSSTPKVPSDRGSLSGKSRPLSGTSSGQRGNRSENRKPQLVVTLKLPSANSRQR